MVHLDPPLRRATEDDGRQLAVFINEASHGLSLYAWRQMAEPGVDPWAFGVGLQSARVQEGVWTVIDEGTGAIAGLQAWPPGPQAVSPATLAMFQPMVELRELVPDAFYVNVLATVPAARGRGFGTRLMRAAEEMARADGLRRLTLVVSDANDGARRLYGRLGYAQYASRPMVKNGWEGPGTAWLLLIRELTDLGHSGQSFPD